MLGHFLVAATSAARSSEWQQSAHRQECLCHVCRLEGGATKGPRAADFVKRRKLDFVDAAKVIL